MAWSYQRGHRWVDIDKGQLTQWSIEQGQNNKQVVNATEKTEIYRSSNKNNTINQEVPRYSAKISNSCSTICTRRVTHVRNRVFSHVWSSSRTDERYCVWVSTTNGTYMWSSETPIHSLTVNQFMMMSIKPIYVFLITVYHDRILASLHVTEKREELERTSMY